MTEIPSPDGGAAARESGESGAAGDATVRPLEGPAGPAGPDGARLRILVLDDDRTTQRFLRYILEKDGYEVTTAGDGVEALLALGQGSFDLILSDLHMPHLDGLQLLAQRTRTGLRVPVVVLSADGSESTVRRCLRLGAADYLRKPVRRDTLLPRVRRALGRGGPEPCND
jgi:DNA-binding response OmpR family regulator